MGSPSDVLVERGVSSDPAWPWRRDRLFFSGMAVAAALVVFAGFAPTYYLKGVFSGRSL